MKRQIAALFALSLMVPTSASAASFLTEFLIGGCLLPEAKFEGVVAFAGAAGWKKAPEDVLPLIKPSQEPVRFEAWVVQEYDGPFIVAASVGVADGIEIPSCTIMGKADISEVEAALAKLGARVLNEADEVVQITKVFEISRLGNRMLVILVHAPGQPDGIMTAAVTDGVD